jgi:hypothetical protein
VNYTGWNAIAIVLVNGAGFAHAKAFDTEVVSCVEHPERQPAKSAELQGIVNADQADRQGPPDKIDWAKVLPRDREREVRVAEIFAEGCFKEAKDYAAAALVYQHGETADHVYQTFVWAKKAVDLGDSTQKWLTVAGLDRYLVRMGQKQLFATQYGKDTNNPCWCLEPVEPTFPDSKRIEWAKLGLDQALERLKSYFNHDQQSCNEIQYCHHDLKPTPSGAVPGFW